MRSESRVSVRYDTNWNSVQSNYLSMYLSVRTYINCPTLNGMEWANFVRWSIITHTALLPFRLWDRAITNTWWCVSTSILVLVNTKWVLDFFPKQLVIRWKEICRISIRDTTLDAETYFSKAGLISRNQRLLVGLDLDTSLQQMRVYSLNLDKGLLPIQVQYGRNFVTQSTSPRYYFLSPLWNTNVQALGGEFRLLNPSFSPTLFGLPYMGRALVFLMIVGPCWSHILSKSRQDFQRTWRRVTNYLAQ